MTILDIYRSYTLELIKAVFDTVFDMVDIVYRDKSLILSGLTFCHFESATPTIGHWRKLIPAYLWGGQARHSDTSKGIALYWKFAKGRCEERWSLVSERQNHRTTSVFTTNYQISPRRNLKRGSHGIQTACTHFCLPLFNIQHKTQHTWTVSDVHRDIRLLVLRNNLTN